MKVETAYEALYDWPVRRVFNHLLHTFEVGAVDVEFCGSKVFIQDLAQRVTGDIPARIVRVKLRGGPLSKGRKQYSGSLLAFLIDELFLQYTLGKWSRVERFLEAASA
jgi:hypothetical protein